MSLRFSFLFFTVAVAVAVVFLYAPIKKQLFRPELNYRNLKDKNIILISIDALRADHLGVYGYHRDTSPSIDRLAQESIVFEQAFSASSYTLASHTSLFTGLYPKTHKVSIKYTKEGKNVISYKKTSLDAKYKTLAEYLSSMGYHTIWSVIRDNPQLNMKGSEARGFQTKLPEIEELSEFFKWVDRNPNKKFFSFFHSEYLHDPYYSKSYDRIPVFATSNYKGSIPGTERETLKKFKEITGLKESDIFRFPNHSKFNRFWWSFVNLEDSKDIQRLKDLYDDCILFVDRVISRLISYLKEKNLYKNTIIILVSDHGEAFGEHGHFRHMALHREILQVPLILYIPDFGSKRIKSQVSLIDVYPTILDLIGQDAPHQMDGKSVLPLIRGTSRKIHDYIFGSFFNETSVSDGKWKLIRTKKGIRELYHIVKDPYEKREVSEKYPNIVKKMDQKIDMFLEQNSE